MTICTKEAFLKSVETHSLKEVVIDDKEKLIRHLRFRRQDSYDCWFDLITWHNSLCINGDHGTHVFSRIDDMFTFFRSKNGELDINPDYWAEKCRSQSMFGEGIKQFSVDTFKDNVKSEFRSHCQSWSDKKKVKPAWQDIDDQIMGCEDEYECIESIRNFRSDHIEFYDFWEHDNTEYSYHFIWCLYAIVWGIKQYDKLYIP